MIQKDAWAALSPASSFSLGMLRQDQVTFLFRGELGLGWDVWPADQGVGCPLLGSGRGGGALLGNVMEGVLQFIRGAFCREGTSSWGSAFLFPWFLVATEVDLWFPIQRRI